MREIFRERRTCGSRPGRRKDGDRGAPVVEGGAINDASGTTTDLLCIHGYPELVVRTILDVTGNVDSASGTDEHSL